MILLTTLWLGALSITGFSSSTGTYDKQITLNDYEKAPALVFGATGSSSHYVVESSVNINFNMSYDSSDDSSYFLWNFRFNVHASEYYINSSGTRELEETVTYSYQPNWEITPSSYNQEFERTKFTIVVNDDEMSIHHFYDDVLVDSESVTLDFYAQPEVNRLQISFNTTNFFQEVDDLLHFSKASYDAGYSQGNLDGALDGVQMNPEMFTIFNGILNIAMIPVNVFLAIFNFEVFGINLASAVTALLSICILIVVIKMVTGGKGDKD